MYNCFAEWPTQEVWTKIMTELKIWKHPKTKKRTSSNACLVVVEKNKNKSNTSKQNDCLWLGFKAMNALNASKGLAEVPHKSVTELVKIGMNEKEALECQG